MATQTESFGPYLLLRTLGRGGMGVVYTARSRHKNHPIVALKRLRADAAQVPSFRERFDHECALALRLQHPRLVQALDAGEINGVPYVASELILGADVGAIADRLKHQGRGAPINIAVRITIDILSGLDYVHQAHEPDGEPLRLVHRDVTPGNVLVGYDGLSRLADFGLAKSLLTEQLQLTADGIILGTPKFVAPEMAQGGRAGPRTDLYGLGAVIYRLLLGRGPYDGDPKEVLRALMTGPPRPLSEARPDIPHWFSDIVESLMARSPDDRPASARGAGLHLVSEARRHEALMPRPRFAQWLKELFSNEHRAHMDQLQADLGINIDLVPTPSEGTRVLTQKKAPLQAPNAAPAQGDVEFDHKKVQASVNPSAISRFVELDAPSAGGSQAVIEHLAKTAPTPLVDHNKMSMPVHGSHGPLDPANPTESSPAAPAFLAGDLAQFNVVKGAPVTVGSPVLNRDPAAPTAPVWGRSGVGSSAIPDEQQWKSDPAAPTEVFEMAHQDTAAGMPLVLTE
ncbi:MAG: serine/threonine-protein kinase, partial [Myxococcota bacterium]